MNTSGTTEIEQRIQRLTDLVLEPNEMLIPISGYESMALVPLESAVEPLLSFLPAIQSHAYVAKERCKNPPPDGLTIDQSASIMLYSMSWKPRGECLYVALNATLRSKDRDKLEPWYLYLKLLLSALECLPSIHRTVYRGVKLDMAKDYPKGKSIVWWGFSSCTTSIDVLQSELFLGTTTARTMFTIECKSGKDIRKHSYFPSEHEILLIAATQFKVVACLNHGNGLHMIQLEETTPPFPLRQPALISNSKETQPSETTTTSQLKNGLDSTISTDENNVLVWLDSSIDKSQDSYYFMVSKLQRIIKTPYTFTDSDQCIDFVTHNEHKNIFIIASGGLGELIISIIHDMLQINGIFIFCSNKSRHEKWAKNWPKIRGVFTEINDLCIAVKKCSEQSTSVSCVTTCDQISKQNLDQLDPSYMYTQILKEILLEIDYNNQHIKNFLTYCREVLAENDHELKNCDKIEQEYSKHTPIWWYTYESFLYMMLNRALRLMDVDIIIKMGFFIRDLCKQIEQLHSEQFNSIHKLQPFTVYRGQGMTKTDFDKLMKTKGGLLSFNNFLTTSTKRNVSLRFVKTAQNNPDRICTLFVMTINPSSASTPYVYTQNNSYYQKSDEIVFSMHSVFRVNDIKQIDNNDRLWEVHLTLTSDTDKDLHSLIECMRKETQGPSGWNRLGKILLKLDHFDKADQLYNDLFSQTSDIHEKLIIYNQLGMTKNGRGEYQQAITFYEKAIDICQKILPSNHPDLAESYDNIGLVYNNMGEYSKSLLFHENALEIRQKILPSNPSDLAVSYNNIGLIYINMGEYSKALLYHEKALEIRQKNLPPNHPDLAKSHDSIGSVYSNRGEYSKALSYHEKALELRQKVLLASHPDLAVSYNNIGLVYANIGEYSKALSYHEKAIEIRQKALPTNHPDLVISYNRIGSVYNNMKEYPKALSYHEKAIEICQNSLLSTHPFLAESYNSIGLIYNNMGEYSKALSYHEKALEIRKQTLCSNYAKQAETYYNIGSVYENMGQHSKALSFYKQAVEIGHSILPQDHPNLRQW